MIQQKLIDKFGGVINHMSCIYLRQGEKHLRSFLEELKPMDTIIEIGTYQGVSACVLAEYSKKLFTYDVEKKPLLIDIVKYCMQDLRTIKNCSIKTFNGTPNKIKDNVKEVFNGEKVDLCFIDGEHFNGELEADFDMCKSCNKILIHDYATNFKDVFDFVNSLKGWKKDVRDTFVLLTKEGKTEIPKENPVIKEQIKTIEKPKKKRARKRKSTKE